MSAKLTFGSLFSGIGGMDLGLERAGMELRWQVEIDPFRVEILKRHWPNVRRYADIQTIKELEPVDGIVGGFPCQDVSCAGLKRGINPDTRSGLWIEYARIIRLLRDRLQFVLIENVSGLLANESMRRVLGDLSTLGFDAEWESIPAAAVGAPHIRDRVWIFAYPRQELGMHERRDYDVRRCNDLFPKRDGREPTLRGKDWELIEMVPGIHPRSAEDWWLRQSRMARSVNGIPRELVDAANAGYGDAVVPQVAEWIGRRIVESAKCYRPEREG